MPRPRKENLDYFPFDGYFFKDIKIRRLKTKYGESGLVVYLYVLCEIYTNKGYYVVYDENLLLDISDYFHYSENKTKQILNNLFSRSLLECILVESVKIITAKSVQRRYQAALKEVARKSNRDIFVDGRFWLLKKEETETCIKVLSFENKSEKNESKSEKNDNKSEKNDTKESKVNKSKVNRNKSIDNMSAEAATITQSPDYSSVIDLFNEICVSLPKVQVLNDKRKRQIKNIKRQFSNDLRSVFERVERSDFLSGRNGKWNGCCFDWIFNPVNFIKIIEGNYDNTENTKIPDVKRNIPTSDDYKQGW